MMTLPVVDGAVVGDIPANALMSAINGAVCTIYMPGDILPTPPTPSLAELSALAVRRIDADVDAIYAAAIGNREPEYRAAETSAQAYVDAGYTGSVPDEVACWADAKGWTATQAADEILAAAATLKAAQQAIRAARLLRKEQVRNAVDEAAVSAAMTAWAGFVAAVKSQLGIA